MKSQISNPELRKTVLITGARGNLGKITVEKFLADGYTVIATVRPGKTLDFESNMVITYEADLSLESKTAQVIKDIIYTHKNIDAALLLAGGFAMGNIPDTDDASLEKMFTLNFKTAYHVARPLFQQMLQQGNGGKIVFVGSRPALESTGGKNMIGYTLSKSLLFKYAELLNEEGASNNVVTSVIVPSIIDTLDNRAAMPKADFEKWVKPEQLANAMLFLCSPTGSALRNTVLKVYGHS